MEDLKEVLKVLAIGCLVVAFAAAFYDKLQFAVMMVVTAAIFEEFRSTIRS